MYGTKVPVRLECPFDSHLYPWVSPFVDCAHNLGLTPNAVTTFSAACCLASLHAYHSKQAWTAALFWALSYYVQMA